MFTMRFIKTHKYILLSSTIVVLAICSIVLFYMPSLSLGNYIWPPYILSLLVPIINALGIFFAYKSKKLKESLWIATYMEVIGILTLIAILFLDVYTLLAMSFCKSGLC